MYQTIKKSWQKPELTILARNTPEESVLYFCKIGGGVGSPFTYADGCEQKGDGTCAPGRQCCAPCASGAPS